MLLKAEGLYVFGPYRLDARERQLRRNGAAIPLPPKAFDLLLALVARAGTLATKEELLSEVWAGRSSRRRISPTRCPCCGRRSGKRVTLRRSRRVGIDSSRRFRSKPPLADTSRQTELIGPYTSDG
jgi:hypothetical protein